MRPWKECGDISKSSILNVELVARSIQAAELFRRLEATQAYITAIRQASYPTVHVAATIVDEGPCYIVFLRSISMTTSETE